MATIDQYLHIVNNINSFTIQPHIFKRIASICNEIEKKFKIKDMEISLSYPLALLKRSFENTPPFFRDMSNIDILEEFNESKDEIVHTVVSFEPSIYNTDKITVKGWLYIDIPNIDIMLLHSGGKLTINIENIIKYKLKRAIGYYSFYKHHFESLNMNVYLEKRRELKETSDNFKEEYLKLFPDGNEKYYMKKDKIEKWISNKTNTSWKQLKKLKERYEFNKSYAFYTVYHDSGKNISVPFTTIIIETFVNKLSQLIIDKNIVNTDKVTIKLSPVNSFEYTTILFNKYYSENRYIVDSNDKYGDVFVSLYSNIINDFGLSCDIDIDEFGDIKELTIYIEEDRINTLLLTANHIEYESWKQYIDVVCEYFVETILTSNYPVTESFISEIEIDDSKIDYYDYCHEIYYTKLARNKPNKKINITWEDIMKVRDFLLT